HAMGIPMDAASAGFRRPIATISIIVLNVIIYILTTYKNSFVSINSDVLWSYGYIPAYFLTDQGIMRIFTSMFLHADPLHIFFNMYFLYIFGKGVESVLGVSRFLTLYIVSGVLASFLHTVSVGFQGASALSIPAVGASGAISGVLGAYLMLYPATPLALCLFLPFPLCGTFRASTFLLFWFIVQVTYGYLRLGGVAFFAHAGGFIAGVALSWLLGRDVVARLKQPFFYTLSVFSEMGEGLGRGAKIVMIIAILSLIGISIYSYYSGTSIDRSQLVYNVNVNIGSSPNEPPYSSSMATLLVTRGSSDFSMSPIVDDTSRILINRLLASNILINTESRGSTEDIRKSLTVTILNVPVPFSISARASYDDNGVMIHGYGSAITRSVVCGATCMLGDVIQYPWFEIRSVGPISIASLITIPLLISMLFLLLSLYIVVAKDREISLSTHW
ncbi:MAG TPA: rhomboid family intramembrane serine protease, partial [Sulfolobales archaeon]|nr:rhomboid family intramembrane serine protease [Sulfolobales archaeon]